MGLRAMYFENVRRKRCGIEAGTRRRNTIIRGIPVLRTRQEDKDGQDEKHLLWDRGAWAALVWGWDASPGSVAVGIFTHDSFDSYERFGPQIAGATDMI